MKNALLYIVGDWNPEQWTQSMQKYIPNADIRIYPHHIGNPDDIAYILAWNPPLGIFAEFKNLKAIFSLGAGVDHIIRDPKIPEHIPIIRMVSQDLTMRMSEYIILHTLMHHRQVIDYQNLQKKRIWKELPQHGAHEMRIGIMGLGILGQDAAQKLANIGFKVSGWSQSIKNIKNITSYNGEENRTQFLQNTDILICLLPHTKQTEGILNKSLFLKLARNGPFKAPVLINAGRGKLQNEKDIIEALNDGTLHGASLDVFNREPLQKESPLWNHPKIILTPHIAATSEPKALNQRIAEHIKKIEAGEKPENIIHRDQEY